MSRPSRGFSVVVSAPTTGNTCPIDMLLALTIVTDTDYQYQCTWSPAVTVGTLTLYGTLNGESIGAMYSADDQVSGATFEFDPADWGTAGDTLACYAVATLVPSCADFSSNTVSTVIP